MTRIVGLDLSLTATGIALGEHEITERVRPKTRGIERLAHILHAVGVAAASAEVVVLEDYGYLQGDALQIIELHGIVKHGLWMMSAPVAIVPPSILKKFTTGKGNANKDAMLASAIRRWGFQGEDNNEADAWMLRHMGLAHYESRAVPEYAREAVAKVVWPELPVEALTS